MPGQTAPYSRRTLLARAWSGAGLLALGLLGCRQPAPTPTAIVAPAAPAALQEVLFWPGSADEAERVWGHLLPLARDRHPGLVVKLESWPAGMAREKLALAVLGGTGPDAAVVPSHGLPRLIGAGLVADMQGAVETDPAVRALLPAFTAAALAGLGVGGRLHAVPLLQEGVVIFYRRDALLTAGLPPPRDVEGDPRHWTWDILLAYARVLTRGGGPNQERSGLGVIGARGSAGGPVGLAALMDGWGNLAYARGARFFDHTGAAWSFTDPAAREAVQWLVDLIQQHGSHPPLLEPGRPAPPSHQDLFRAGRLGLLVEREGFGRALWGPAPQGNWAADADLARLPVSPATGERTTIYQGTGAFMAKETPRPEATWKWLALLFGLEAQEIIADRWGTRAAHSGTHARWLAARQQARPDVNHETVLAADTDMAPFPLPGHLSAERVFEPLTRILHDEIFPSQLSVAAGLERIARQTEALLGQG